MTVYSPLLKQRRILAAKIETTVGTDATPSASDAVFNIFDATIDPDIAFEQRERQTSFSPLNGTVGLYKGTCKFKTELIGGATDPAWMTVFMPTCGWVASSHVWSPQTNAPGAGGVKTLTISVYEDGTLKKLVGAMGNWEMTMNAGQRIMIEFSYQGVWVAPVDAALITPTSITTAPLLFKSSGLLIGGSWIPRVSQLTLSAGNDVQMREDSTGSGGLLSAYIAGRRMTGKFDPEATTVAHNDAYGQFLAGTQQSLALALGTTGNAIAIAAPAMQISKPTEGDRNKLQTDQLEFQLNGSSSAGDDEATITNS
jgi:hypothetical protein